MAVCAAVAFALSFLRRHSRPVSDVRFFDSFEDEISLHPSMRGATDVSVCRHFLKSDRRKRLSHLLLLGLLPFSLFGQSVNLAGPWKLKVDDSLRWAQPDVDDSVWPVVMLPKRTPRVERSYWLRRTLPAPVATGEMEVAIGLVSESYDLYVNGVLVGGTGDFGATNLHFPQPRSFHVPAELISTRSRVVVALHIWNTNIAWGAFSNGVSDEGPYVLTHGEHARAELRAARQGLRIALAPALMVIFCECWIGLCLLLLWLFERKRRELIYFAGFLLLAGLSGCVGIWVAFTSGPFSLQRWAYRPVAGIMFLFLYLTARTVLRTGGPPAYLVSGVCVLSLALSVQTTSVGYYLLPWMLLVGWQCLRAIQISPRDSLPFALPILVFAVGILNNIAPAGWRLFPSSINAAGMTLSVTNLMLVVFATVMLILLLLRLLADRREKQRLTSEFEAARGVQHFLLAGAAEPSHDYEVETAYLPAQEVGGDLYYVLPDDSGGFALVVGRRLR